MQYAASEISHHERYKLLISFVLPRPIEFLIYTPDGVTASEYELIRFRLNSKDREFRVRECVYVVSGVATFEFNHYNRDGSIEQHVVSVNSPTSPIYIRQNANVYSQHLKLQIHCIGNGVVHEVRFGLQTDVHYPHNVV